MSRCDRCLAQTVIPAQWHEHDDEHWSIRLRCGECAFVRDVVVTDEEARRFERELDRGVAEVAAVLSRLERARMAEEIDVLAMALRHDLVDAQDFDRPPDAE